MSKQTIAQVSEKTLKLQEYLKDKKEGTEISYNRIQSDTGVTMDDRGKSYVRTAFKRLNKVYSVIKGYGIKVADSTDTMPILVNKLTKIDKAVKRADKTQKTLESQFFDQLNPNEQKQILYLGAVFGAIRVAADKGRVLYQKKNMISQSSINIPFPNM